GPRGLTCLSTWCLALCPNRAALIFLLTELSSPSPTILQACQGPPAPPPFPGSLGSFCCWCGPIPGGNTGCSLASCSPPSPGSPGKTGRADVLGCTCVQFAAAMPFFLSPPGEGGHGLWRPEQQHRLFSSFSQGTCHFQPGLASRSGRGAHVQQPWYFHPTRPPGIPQLRALIFFLLSPRTTATCILFLSDTGTKRLANQYTEKAIAKQTTSHTACHT
ncbi:hypothetical protein E2320_008503, partial [Naja naja]